MAVTAFRRAVAGGTPPLSPGRAKLAEQIEKKGAADRRLQQLQEARERAWRARREAEDARDAAAAKASEQQVIGRKEIVDAFLTGAPQPSTQSPAAAQTALAEAEAALAQAERVKAAVEEEIEELTRGAVMRDMLHDDALHAVLREEAQPAIAALMAAATQQYNQLAELAHALEWLVAKDIAPDRGPNGIPGMMEWTVMAANLKQFARWPASPPETTQKWIDAIERLKADPAAELPR